MADSIKLLSEAMKRLASQARPRPDLITPGSTGKLENARPMTFLGRVSRGDESLEDLLGRFPQGELESAGQGMDPAMLAAGIPLGRLMKLPTGVNLDKTLEEMWQQFKSHRPKANRDAWIKTKLDDLAMSTYKRGAHLSGGGMDLPQKPGFSRPDLRGMVLGNEDTNQGISSMRQLAATLHMADRSGMLNAENLGRATARQSAEFGGVKPQQDLLDQLAAYLEQIRPGR